MRTTAVRRLIAGLTLALGVVGLLLLAGGWYFADQIRTDGLSTTATAAAYDLTVTSVTGTTVGLHEGAGQPQNAMLRAPGVYGLAWTGGTGVLSANHSLGGGAALRTLTLTTGVAPGVGSPARLRRDVFDTPAQATGITAQDAVIPCAAGQCPAWFLPGASTTWAILVHGKGATRTEPLRALRAVHAAGVPALVISYRNDPGTPADPSGYHRYGATEWTDLDNAVVYAQHRGAQNVVLVGFSMGGGIIASFLEHSSRRSVITGLVLDAPMLSFRRTVTYGASQRRLPLVGLPIPQPLTWTAQTLAGWRFGISWDNIDYVSGGWLRAPTLLFHGTEDDTVPIATSDDLRRAHPQLVQEIRVDNAAHVASWNADPGRYTTTLQAFVQRVVPVDNAARPRTDGPAAATASPAPSTSRQPELRERSRG